jgi:hypothetical protein
MRELSTLISDYMDFRAARGFRPNRKTEHLLTQFADTLSAERDDGLLFSQGEALAWAHAPRRRTPGMGVRPVVYRQTVRDLPRRLRPASGRARSPSRSRRIPPGDAISVLVQRHPGSDDDSSPGVHPTACGNDDDSDRAARGHGHVLQGSVPVRRRDSLSLCSSEADGGMLVAATGVVQADSRVSSQPGWCVESGHEFAVGRSGGGEVFLAFVESLLKVEIVLFELADALVEGVDIGGGA